MSNSEYFGARHQRDAARTPAGSDDRIDSPSAVPGTVALDNPLPPTPYPDAGLVRVVTHWGDCRHGGKHGGNGGGVCVDGQTLAQPACLTAQVLGVLDTYQVWTGRLEVHDQHSPVGAPMVPHHKPMLKGSRPTADPAGASPGRTFWTSCHISDLAQSRRSSSTDPAGSAVKRPLPVAVFSSLVPDSTIRSAVALPSAYKAGDVVGLSGLQAQFQAQLSGQDGVVVTVTTASPSVSTSPGSSAAPSPSSSPTGSGQPDRVLFQVDPKAGAPLQLTLDPTVQQAADTALEAATKRVNPAISGSVFGPQWAAFAGSRTVQADGAHGGWAHIFGFTGCCSPRRCHRAHPL